MYTAGGAGPRALPATLRGLAAAPVGFCFRFERPPMASRRGVTRRPGGATPRRDLTPGRGLGQKA